MTVTTAAVLAEVNARHHTAWQLEGRLSGGYQSGAHLLTDEDRRPAVLKWSRDLHWAPTVLAAAPVVAAARGRGWPTPAWLAVGLTGDGFAYQVQDFVEGTTQEVVTHAWLDLVLPVITAHAGSATEAMRNWSGRDHEVVHADRGGHQALIAASGPEGAHLVEAIRSTTGAHRDAVLPAGDLVHGDLNPENVLIHRGRATALIDVEALGRGSRLHDLSTLLLHAALWGQSDVLDRLIAECRGIAAPGWFEISLGARTAELLAFGVRHWPPRDLRTACGTARRTLARLFPA